MTTTALHRLPLVTSLAVTALLCTACAGAARRSAVNSAGGAAVPAAEPAPEMASSEAAGFSDVNTDPSLVTNSHVRAWTDDLLSTASRFRAQVYAADGYVVNERIDFADPLRARTAMLPTRAPRGERGKAVFSVSVPIQQLPGVLDWVRGNARVVEQYVYAVRDPAQPAPSAAGPQIATSAPPPVRYTTLNVYLESERPQAQFAAARIAPSVRGSLLVTDVLGDHGGAAVRGGVAVGIAVPTNGAGGISAVPLVEVSVYPSHGDSDSAVFATIGMSTYARSRGDGGKTWLNPFVGLRAGYAHLAGNAAVVAGELGLEVYKSDGVALSASVRPQGVFGEQSLSTLEAGGSLSVAF